jgi:hypothetical protein
MAKLDDCKGLRSKDLRLRVRFLSLRLLRSISCCLSLSRCPLLVVGCDGKDISLCRTDIREIHLAAQDRNSEIGIFLREKGEGMHHICYEVDDLEGILESLREKGVKLITGWNIVQGIKDAGQ